MAPPAMASGRARVLAGATAVLTLAYLAVYVLVVRSQGESDGTDGSGVVWWYVTALLLAVVASGAAAATGRVRRVLPACAGMLGGCALLGLLSVGLLLLPAVVTGVLAARASRSEESPGR